MIGIYGGTFDPVHFGHLRPALDVMQGLALNEIRFIPCGQPPHRQQPVASAEHRLVMLNMAVSEQAGFIVDERELQRPGPSYMVDTLQDLKQEMPQENFCLIVGMDAFISFDSWKDWQTILTVANIVVTHRPNSRFNMDQVDAELAAVVTNNKTEDVTVFQSSSAGRILFYPVTQLDISSTFIRDSLKDGRNVRYLLPQCVIDYIEQNNVY